MENELQAPFKEEDLEWRVSRSGEKDGRPWAKVLVYVTNRAIMDRLDDVVGCARWQNRYEPGPDGGVVCGISIKIGDEWITKWDGAENTTIDPIKGGLSGSMKRCAAQWGIARYLYHMTEAWAVISPNGSHSDKTKGGTWFKWDPPMIPPQFLPEGVPPKKVTPAKVAEVFDAPPPNIEDASKQLLETGKKLDAVMSTGVTMGEIVALVNKDGGKTLDMGEIMKRANDVKNSGGTFDALMAEIRGGKWTKK